MKARLLLFLVALTIICVLPVGILSAQTITTNGTGGGKWSVASTWAGGVVPTGSGTITIASTDSVIFDVPISIAGTLLNQSAKRDSIGASGSLTIANGGTYQHDVDGGYVPPVAWATGSTYLLTGMAGNKPSNGSQNFYNVTINLGTGYTAAKDLGWVNNTIGGNLRAICTDSVQVRLSSPSTGHGPTPNTITINGNFLVDSSRSSIALNGSSTADTMYLIIKGNLVSKGLVSMGGSALINNWYIQGNISFLGGAFSTNSAAPADTLILNGTTKQSFISTLASLSNVRTLVRTGTIVDLDTNRVGNNANQAFVLEPGASIITGQALGLVGNINTTASKALSKSASYTYDGTVAQADTLLPDTVKNLTINNPAGFALSRATVVTGVLKLQAGVLNNTSPNTITIAPGGSVVFSGGSTTSPIPGWPATSVETTANHNPHSFVVYQNFPNPFNPSTIIGYELPKSSSVKVTIYDILGNEVRLLARGVQSAGYHSVTFNAQNLSSGMYFYKLQAGEFTQTRKMILLK